MKVRKISNLNFKTFGGPFSRGLNNLNIKT